MSKEEMLADIVSMSVDEIHNHSLTPTVLQAMQEYAVQQTTQFRELLKECRGELTGYATNDGGLILRINTLLTTKTSSRTGQADKYNGRSKNTA